MVESDPPSHSHLPGVWLVRDQVSVQQQLQQVLHDINAITVNAVQRLGSASQSYPNHLPRLCHSTFAATAVVH